MPKVNVAVVVGSNRRDSINRKLAQALEDAAEAYEEGQAALREGDFAAYGEANERLKEALDRAKAASGSNEEKDE